MSHMGNIPQSGSVAADLLTTAQVARILGVSVATVNRWADSGELPTAFKAPGLRGARLFHTTEVEARRTTQAAS